MNTFTIAVYLFGLAVARQSGTAEPHSINDVLKDHGLPLLAAKEAHVDAMCPALWAGFLPTIAGRLVTTGLHPVYTEEEARKLAGGVLIYCSEPAKLRRWVDLLLRAALLGAEMARATPFMGKEAASLPFRYPLNFTLVFLDRHGRVRRVERRDIIELATDPQRK